MCHFWHAGILKVPGVFGRLVPGKGKWLFFALWQLAKDFDLSVFQVGQGKLQSQHAGHGQQVLGKLGQFALSTQWC